MATATTIKMPGTPKPWMNTVMRRVLRVPGLRRQLGKSLAVITVTGSKTGRRYSTPVQYIEVEGRYVVLSQKHRVWWRNIKTQPAVNLEIGGVVVHGQAVLAVGTDAQNTMLACLQSNQRLAKFYGLNPDAIDRSAADQLLEHLVVIAITPEP